MHQETFELAVRVGEWYDRKVENILNVMEGVKEGVTLKIGDSEEDTVLTAEQAKFLKLGMIAIFNEFAELPYSIEGFDGDADELDDGDD
jgi:hypothetical protein